MTPTRGFYGICASRPSGRVRDAHLLRFCGHPAVIVEVKTTVDRDGDLKSLAAEALEQIDGKRYADEPGTKDAIRMGIGARMKTVEVAFERFRAFSLCRDIIGGISDGNYAHSLP